MHATVTTEDVYWLPS